MQQTTTTSFKIELFNTIYAENIFPPLSNGQVQFPILGLFGGVYFFFFIFIQILKETNVRKLWRT